MEKGNETQLPIESQIDKFNSLDRDLILIQ